MIEGLGLTRIIPQISKLGLPNFSKNFYGFNDFPFQIKINTRVI